MPVRSPKTIYLTESDMYFDRFTYATDDYETRVNAAKYQAGDHLVIYETLGLTSTMTGRRITADIDYMDWHSTGVKAGRPRMHIVNIEMFEG